MSLTVGFANFPPWMYADGNQVAIEKNPLFSDMYYYFKNEFNATFSKMPSHAFGKEQEDGNWTGVVGMVHRQEIDSALQLFLPEESLLRAMDLSTPVYYTFTSILSGSRNAQASVDVKYIFNVFDSQVWAGVFICLFLVSTVSAYSETLIRRLPTTAGYFVQHLATQTTRYWGFLYSEPFEYLPESQSSKILVLAWCVSVLILQYAYHSNLKSTFASISVTRIDTLDDVVARPDLRVLMHAKSYYEQVLGTSTLKLYKSLYQMVLRKRGFVELEEMQSPEALDQVATGQAVIVLDIIPISFYLQELRCESQEYMLAKFPVWFHPVTLALGKHLPQHTRRKINSRFSMYATTQQLIPHLRKFSQRGARCMRTVDTQDTLTISLSRFTWSFIVYLIGLLIALSVFLTEIYYARKNVNKQITRSSYRGKY